MENSVFLVIVIALSYISGGRSAIFTVRNNCPYTIWPAIFSGEGATPTSGFELASQASTTIDIGAPWSGKFWARTQCSSAGTFTCVTGDCGSGEIACNGKGGAPPVTLAEWSLAGDAGKDFYDVSNLHGFNVPLSIKPDGSCPSTACHVDINQGCPTELAVKDPSGATVGCKSACAAFNESQYCCTGDYGTQDKCKPTSYSEMFKDKCPQAYSYAFDDTASIFTCPTGGNYLITFCPIELMQKPEPPYFCYNDAGNYTSNSTYQTNLRTLFSNLSASVDQNGFYNASVGENNNTSYGVAFCRADVQLDFCRACIQNASDYLVQLCPNQRQAVVWQQYCMLRYSNASIIGTMYTSPARWMRNVQNSTRPDEFMSDLRILLDNISSQASTGGPLRKVGYGSLSTVGFQTINALEQCTPDLSADDCLSCLHSAEQEVPRQFYGRMGLRILQPSCNLRYEVYTFYNETRLLELAHITTPPSAPTSAQVKPPEQGNGGNNDNNTTRTIIIVVVSVIGGIIVLVILIGYLRWRMRNKPEEEETERDEISNIESMHYDFSVIQEATNGFSEANKLGQGGFGVVYKGKLSNGEEIAVKRLSIGSCQGDLEFKNEVILLAKLQHRNLVRLFGFSIQGQEKLLIYEIVQNASLDQFLFDEAKSSQLDWNRRYKIIRGIARGILYLHEDSRVRIIHRDLKASNVLLDGEMHPKIADFGMARLFVPDETHNNTSRIVGTYGYMAPEYATRGHFSIKSDVYSFGVLLLEIISGVKNNCSRNGETEEDLISSAWGNWRNGNAANLVDPVLKVGFGISRDILRCIHIGLLCVQESAAQRPTMATIVVMLNSNSITLPMPSRPAFCVHDGYDSESSILQEFNSREGSLTRQVKNGGDESAGDSKSQNEMSIGR